MNYNKIYYSIIDRARSREKAVGLERHHIIPASCGGTNNKENLVYLTTREHFICHLLLVKVYKDNSVFRKKMIYALWWMGKTARQKGVKITSHLYEFSRKEFIKNNPNKDDKRKQQFIENHKAGLYKYDYKKVSNTLKSTISKLTDEEKLKRMKNSALSCDQEKRAYSIRKGKGSQFLLRKKTGETINFWSYDDVEKITGFKYNQILYRIKAHQGILQNGDFVKFITRYTANDKNIGRKRNNSI